MSPNTVSNPPVNGKKGLFKAFKCFSSTFQDKFNFQGFFKTVLYIQVLFKPVLTMQPQTSLRELFPDLDLNKLQKAHTAKSQTYNVCVFSHCRLRHVTFQIGKCKDENCCLPTRIQYEELSWLPVPVIDASGDHYKPYTEREGLGNQ